MKKFLAVKIILALLPAIIFAQNWAWMSSNKALGLGFVVFWILMIWQVIASEDKNYVLHRLLWLSEVGFFLLPLSAIGLTLGIGSKLVGSTSGAAQAGAALGMAIGGFFAVILGAVVGLFGGLICRAFSKKFEKKMAQDSGEKEFFAKSRNWAFLAGVIVLIIAASAGRASAPADSNVPATSGDENAQVANQPSAEQQQAEQIKKDIEEKLKVAVITSSKIENDIIGTPNLVLSLKNNSQKTIDGIEIQAEFFNNFDEPVKGMSFDNEPFSGRSQQIIKPSETKDLQWSLMLYNGATKAKNIKITRIHFTDGEDIKLE